VCSTAPSLTEQYEYAHEHCIKWLVIITEAGLSQNDSVEVKNDNVLKILLLIAPLQQANGMLEKETSESFLR
jgi:hypothetical protein